MIQWPHFPRYLDKYRRQIRGSSEASGKYGFRAAPSRMPPLHRSCKNCLFSRLLTKRANTNMGNTKTNTKNNSAAAALISDHPVYNLLTVHIIGVCLIKWNLWLGEIRVSVSGIFSLFVSLSKLDDGVTGSKGGRGWRAAAEKVR